MEAVTLTVTVNGRYSQHLPLVRTGTAEYRVLLGSVEAGTHVIRTAIDREATAVQLREEGVASSKIVRIEAIAKTDPAYEALSFAPFLYARPNTIGRFTDVPVFMWYEREPTSRGVRYRYSAVFTNEDGGTPADRLMATWGRTTDIEYVYSVELDRAGQVIDDDIQGPEHKILRFKGRREGQHPLLWVSTDNNMVLDSGATRIRYAPAPVSFPLDGVSREAVMDAHPWLYSVASHELAREKKIVPGAPPGNGTIPDPRTFIYVEACGDIGDAALAFEVLVGDTWVPSDRGVARYRIQRDGCFRVAIPIGSARPSAVRRLRAVAHPRATSNGTPAAAGTSTARTTVRLDRVNAVFMLDDAYAPGESMLRWTESAEIPVGGPPLEIPVR